MYYHHIFFFSWILQISFSSALGPSFNVSIAEIDRFTADLDKALFISESSGTKRIEFLGSMRLPMVVLLIYSTILFTFFFLKNIIIFTSGYTKGRTNILLLFNYVVESVLVILSLIMVLCCIPAMDFILFVTIYYIFIFRFRLVGIPIIKIIRKNLWTLIENCYFCRCLFQPILPEQNHYPQELLYQNLICICADYGVSLVRYDLC